MNKTVEWNEVDSQFCLQGNFHKKLMKQSRFIVLPTSGQVTGNNIASFSSQYQLFYMIILATKRKGLERIAACHSC